MERSQSPERRLFGQVAGRANRTRDLVPIIGDKGLINLEVVAGTANFRSEPSSANGDATVIASFPVGTQLTQLSYVQDHPDWIHAKAPDDRIGFMKRSLLAQVNPGILIEVDPELLAAYDQAILLATAQYDGVKYGLGSKQPSEGKVDCSGWIAFINRLAFNAVNAAAGSKVFSTRALEMLNTHSDHQVSVPGYEAGQLFSCAYVDTIPWRPGLLVGINFGDYDWERGQGRVFGIDHIVQTMSGSDGSMRITQSSSSGGGVNLMPLDDWFGKVSEFIPKNCLHVVDIFALAELARGREVSPSLDLELPELDVSRAPPG
jgi:hypothetical protein